MAIIASKNWKINEIFDRILGDQVKNSGLLIMLDR